MIIKKVKAKYWSRTHKYGILIPKSIKEAFDIDIKNRNNLWKEAIALEIKNYHIAFKQIDGDPHELVGYQDITRHLVFWCEVGRKLQEKSSFCAD